MDKPLFSYSSFDRIGREYIQGGVKCDLFRNLQVSGKADAEVR